MWIAGNDMVSIVETETHFNAADFHQLDGNDFKTW